MSLTKSQIVLTMTRKLRELGFTEPPIDGFKFAKRLGIEVIKMAFFDRRLAGLLVKGEYCSSIYLNELTPERWQFSLFHEISHYLLHPAGVYLEPVNGQPLEDNIERQANIGAAEAIMPQRWVRKLGPVYRWDPELLAERFEVSVQAMRIRLKELGLPVLY